MPKGLKGFQKNNNLGENNKGKKHTLETRLKFSLAHKKGQLENEKSYAWKGDKVSYNGLHKWVSHKLGKPKKCEHCGKDGLTGKQIDWANKSGKYLRDLTDWIRLCRPCHIKYDKRLL